jgi:predicted transcriptional regulator
MATLQELLKRHLDQRNISVKTLAERLGISYPTVLALINKGSLPRSQDHRECLRKELGVEPGAWAAVLAASRKDAVDIPEDGPLTLQQLITKAILTRGQTELSLAESSGLPYPTLLGITRKGAIPRSDTLIRLGEVLQLTAQEIDQAAALSRLRRGQDSVESETDSDENAPTDAPGTNLAQLVLDAITRSGSSAAAFAKRSEIPYLSLIRLIRDGVPPARGTALSAIKAGLGLDDETFEAALDRSRADPMPANRAKSSEIASNPLQASLLKLVETRGLTVKAFADLADLSVLTATRLLKKGDLPGRVATHGKLRGLLGLREEDYQLLLQRARAAGAAETDGDHDAQPTAMPPITEAIRRIEVERPPGSFTEAFSAGVKREPTDEDFMLLIRRLGPKQRRALMGFMLTLAG